MIQSNVALFFFGRGKGDKGEKGSVVGNKGMFDGLSMEKQVLVCHSVGLFNGYCSPSFRSPHSLFFIANEPSLMTMVS